MNIKFSTFGRTLGTRFLGKQIRESILDSISQNKNIIFDFKDVEIVSNSFADECFGKLTLDLPIAKIKKNTSFKNTNDTINMIIIKALNDRLRETA